MMAMRVLSKEEWQSYEHRFEQLSSDKVQREQQLEEIADELETGLTLIGATAVEDKLQPNVPWTISQLILANIRIWMLTGDKMETAENIARSCELI